MVKVQRLFAKTNLKIQVGKLVVELRMNLSSGNYRVYGFNSICSFPLLNFREKMFYSSRVTGKKDVSKEEMLQRRKPVYTESAFRQEK